MVVIFVYILHMVDNMVDNVVDNIVGEVYSDGIVRSRVDMVIMVLIGIIFVAYKLAQGSLLSQICSDFKIFESRI